MLDIFRKQAGSWVIKALFVIIILVFVLWGGYSYKTRQQTEVAKVGDHYISVVDFNKTYNNLLENYKRQFGGSLPEEMLKHFDLKQQALEMLIDNYVIAKAGQDLGFSATDEEVQAVILQYPAFQKNGKFDADLYSLLLRQNHMMPEYFEQQTAKDITVKRVVDFIRRRAIVTDAEILADYHASHDRIQAAYVLFDPASFESHITADDKSLQSWYQEHQGKYMDVEKRRIGYVLFKTEDYLSSVEISPDEVRQYYDENQADYHHQAEVRASHILFPVKEDAPKADVDKAEAEAQKVSEEARKGADFAALAKKYSKDPGTADKGGDLGYFTKDKMVEAFSNAAFVLKPGEVSGPVRTPFGFHVIKAVDVRPEKTFTFEEVKGEIENKLKKDKARDLCRRKARDFNDAAFAQQDIEKAAQAGKLAVNSAGSWMARTDKIEGVGESSGSVMGKLFALPEKGVSDTLEFPDGFIVAQVMAVQPPQVLAFEIVKGRVEKDYKEDRGRSIALQKATEALDSAKKAGSLDEAAKADKLEVKKTGFFSRAEPDKDLRLTGESLNMIFSLNESTPFVESPVTEVGNRYLVCMLTGRQPASEEGLQKEKDTITQRLLSQKQNLVWTSWLQEMRSKIEVTRYKEL